MEDAFTAELKSLLNKHCIENGSNTPDFILAGYMKACLEAFTEASKSREQWYGYQLAIGGPRQINPELVG